VPFGVDWALLLFREDPLLLPLPPQLRDYHVEDVVGAFRGGGVPGERWCIVRRAASWCVACFASRFRLLLCCWW